MKTYQITYGSGLAIPHQELITVEDYEHEQDALDKLADTLEENGNEGCFLSQEDIDSGDYTEDTYVICGNHNRYLAHYGYLSIEQI